MCDIERSNFDEKLFELKNALKSATFVALDTEFTGLTVSKRHSPSLFDTGSHRYEKLKKNIEQVIIIQIGLSAFRFIRDENRYEVNQYRIPVFPCSFGSVDTVYVTQASSAHFLCAYDFDFNQVMYEGIPYLNLEQEKKLKHELQQCKNVIDVGNLSFLEEEMLRHLKAEVQRVVDWIPVSCTGDQLLLTDFQKFKMKKQLAYVIHMELRLRFNTIWTYNDEGGIVVVKIMKEKHVLLMANQDTRDELDQGLMDSLLGFSHIFKLLVELKKPIVGHNCLLDIMLLYQQFHETLPAHYNTFKKKITGLFPNIYDTKHISFEVRRMLDKDVLKSTILFELYEFFQKGKGSLLAAYSPTVEIVNCRDDIFQYKIHDAAWDSYYSGYCFVRMAHVTALKKFEWKIQRPLVSTEHFTALKDVKNKINVIRCAVSHICLDGADPCSTRPQWIHVETRTHKKISLDEVYHLFNQFDSVDVISYSRTAALVAVANNRSAEMILKKVRENEDLRVCNYSLIKHNNLLRSVLWLAAASTSVTSLWLITKLVSCRQR